MSIGVLFNQTLTLVRTTGVERSAIGGVSVDTEDRVDVSGYCEPMLGTTAQRENEANRNTGVSEWRAFLPAGTDVTGWDRVEWGGHTFDITAPPIGIPDPRAGGATHHIEIELREVT